VFLNSVAAAMRELGDGKGEKRKKVGRTGRGKEGRGKGSLKGGFAAVNKEG